MLAGGLIRDNLQAHLTLARVCGQPRSSTPTPLPVRTKPSSTCGAAGETSASPGDPVEQLALVTLELDFCVLERAGTRVALNETDDMDEEEH